MTGLNADIPESFQPFVQGPAAASPSAPPEEAATTEPDSGVSTIEQSTTVAIPLTPPLNFPFLVTPKEGSEDTVVVFALAMNGMEAFILSQELKLQEITNDMLDAWNKNLREIEEQVRQLLNSPIYQQQQEIRLQGDPSQGNVSGVQSATAANAQAAHPTPTYVREASLTSFIERLQTFSRVPPTANVSDPSSPDDPTKMLTIPLTASLFIGGALALGTFEMSTSVSGMSSNPFNGTMEFINRIQPLFPHLVQDVLPMINLMIMPLIYFTSWDSTIGSLSHKERENHLAAAQAFAEKVIKMVGDPTFILVTIVNKMEGAERLDSQQRGQLVAMISLILTTVALSLLYSMDVGKTLGGKFGGMEPQEFRDILFGNLSIGDPSNPKLTESQRLELTLLSLLKAQLGALSPADKEKVFTALFEYLTTSRDVKSMLDPAKVFEQVFSGESFNPGTSQPA